MNTKVDDAVALLSTMTQDELSAVADDLIWLYEGRGRTLATFLEFAAQDKDITAAEEHFYNPIYEV